MRHFVPIKDKMLLTLDEASALSGLGKNTLIKLVKEEHPELGVKVGNAQKIKRELLENYLMQVTYIESFAVAKKEE